VLRHELLKYLVAKAARVDAVNRRKEECSGEASHPRHGAHEHTMPEGRPVRQALAPATARAPEIRRGDPR
jgi:hypothetical protein